MFNLRRSCEENVNNIGFSMFMLLNLVCFHSNLSQWHNNSVLVKYTTHTVNKNEVSIVYLARRRPISCASDGRQAGTDIEMIKSIIRLYCVEISEDSRVFFVISWWWWWFQIISHVRRELAVARRAGLFSSIWRGRDRPMRTCPLYDLYLHASYAISMQIAK